MFRRAPEFARNAFAAVGLLCACASPPPPSEIAFLSTRADVVSPRILRQEVEGEWCFTQNVITLSLRPPWRVRLADTGRAVSRAIESVPGANVLVDARVRTRVEQYLLFQRVCSVVVGDAGQLR